MRIFYSRVSSTDNSQRHDRQLQNLKDFDYVLTDNCSGSIPLFERPKGKQIKKMIDDDSSIFLCFNPKQTSTLFKHYETDSIEDLFEAIHQHFTTYNSLKRYQDFLNSRGIFSTISSSCALTE